MKRIWTDKLDNLLRRHYPSGDLDALAERLGVTRSAVKCRAQVLGLRRKVHPKQPWTERQLAFLSRHYATMPMTELERRLRHKRNSIYNKAQVLGLERSAEVLSEQGRKVSRHPNSVARRFQKGQTPANKGKRQEEFMSAAGIERTKATRFRPGQTPHNTRPVGYERIDKNGYVLVKVEGERKMVHKHRHVWQQHYGPIPNGMLVTFRDGNRQNCDIENLELRSMADNARRTVSSETPESRRRRLEKGKAKRDESIARDRRRIRLGLKPLTKLVQRTQEKPAFVRAVILPDYDEIMSGQEAYMRDWRK